ncbi:hypothetical protein BJ875DRAFT_527008 [Amylocarpus encephaloides]|uniref:Uncharacterized protein n=1 Tax=Amylocarpus encephaloides TaxID=45428 RepID=A0A9P7YSR1_9HELO|nr:hypothetical protein BJ875DRAFT_527008 [Amylocarpus encephaloides]
MLDPEEQESKILHENVEFVNPASSQGSSPLAIRAEPHDGTKIASGLNLGQESMEPSVDDGQFENLAPDTQAPERLGSRVDETQYANLELDSQAPDQTTFATTKDNPGLHNGTMPPPRRVKDASVASIVRPVIDDANDISTMFKFGKANRPVIGQFNAKTSHRKANPATTTTVKSSSNTIRCADESILPQAFDQPSHSISKPLVVSKQGNGISIASDRTNPNPRSQSLPHLSSSSTATLTTNLEQQKGPAAQENSNNSSFHAGQQDLGVNSSSGAISSSTRRQNQAVSDATNIHTSGSILPPQHVDQPPVPSCKATFLPPDKVSTGQDAPTSAYIDGENAVPHPGLVSNPRVLRNVPPSNLGRPTSFGQQIPRPPSPIPSVLGISGSKHFGSKTPRRSSGRVKPYGFPGRISPRTPKTAVRLTIKHPFPDVHVENLAKVTHYNSNDVNTTREANDTRAQNDFHEHYLRNPKELTEAFDEGIQNGFANSRPHRVTPPAPFGSEVAPQQTEAESSSRAGSQCPALVHTGEGRSRPPSRSNMAARMNRSSNTPIQRRDAEVNPPVFQSHQSRGVSKTYTRTKTSPKTPPVPISHSLLDIESLASRADNSTVFGPLCQRVLEARSHYISASDEVKAKHEELERLKTSEATLQMKVQVLETEKSSLNQRLRTSVATLQEKVQVLETEKSSLNQRLKRFIELKSKYVKHMNKVVTSQNELKEASTLLRNDSSKAIELCKASKSVEATTAASRISSALQEIKAMRIEADKAVVDERLVSALRSQVERSVQENQAAFQQLIEVSTANEGLQTEINDLKRANRSLEKSLGDYLLEMQTDKNKAERLQGQLDERTASEKALGELITNIPKEILKEFANEQGILAADAATQAKLEEISGFINELKNFEVKPTATLVELIKSLSDRIPEPQPQKDTEAPREQFISNLFDNLKTWFNQFSLKSQTQVNLEKQISGLQKSNSALELNIRDDENKQKKLEHQIQVAEGDLSDCRKQLELKSQELVAAIAVPKEDPRLLARISELETSKIEICKQLETSRTKVATLEQEKTTFEESTATAETKINSLEQNQARLVARHKEETQKTAALAEKIKTENDAMKDNQLSNLRKTLVLKEGELNKANDELKQAIEEIQLLKSHNGHEQREAFIDLVELRKSFDLDTRTGTEESAVYLVEQRLKEATSKIESAWEDAVNIGALAAAQAEFDSKIKKNETDTDLLKKEVTDLKAENSRLLNLHARSRQPSSPATFAKPPLSTSNKDVTVTQSVLGPPEETLRNNTTSRTFLRKLTEILENQEEPQPSKPRHGVAEGHASTYFNSSRKATIQRNPKKGLAKDLTMMFQNSAKVQRENRLYQASSVQSKSARLATSSRSAAQPSSDANSGWSSTSSFSDLSMALDTMDGREVDTEHEKRRRENHGALENPAQSVVSQSQRPLAGAVILSSEPLVSQHVDVTAIFSTKQRREPGHRQPQADLKSAMKPTSGTVYMEKINNQKNDVVPAQPPRRIKPLQEKSTAQGINKVQTATTKHQPPYNRVAGSLPARDGLADNKHHNTIKALLSTSPVHNGGALRRSSSWKGFGSDNKRTAETEVQPSKPAKIPRMSYALGHGSRK